LFPGEMPTWPLKNNRKFVRKEKLFADNVEENSDQKKQWQYWKEFANGLLGEILETDSSGQDVSSEQFDKWIKDQVIEYELGEEERKNKMVPMFVKISPMRELAGNTVVNDASASLSGSTTGGPGLPVGELAMVLEGPALVNQMGINAGNPYAHYLTNIGSISKAVVCCVMQPSWKAQVAECVKAHMGKRVLCVGDGANDVPMIKAAHVGVGIAGVEGQGAKNASDFAITEFSHLKKIVLVHGRWSYMRIAYCCMYILYKNIAFCLAFALFAPFSGWSGQILYDDMVLAAYNVLFTAYPITMWGIFEKDVDSLPLCMRNPQLYWAGQRFEYLNIPLFAIWTLEAIWHACVTFFFCYNIIGYRPSADGLDFSMWDAGNACFTSILLVVAIRLAIDTRCWVLPTHIFYYGSVILWFLFIYVYSTMEIGAMGFNNSNQYGTAVALGSSLLFYATIPITVFMSLLPTIATYGYQVIFGGYSHKSRQETCYTPLQGCLLSDEDVQAFDNILDPNDESYTYQVHHLRVSASEKSLSPVDTEDIPLKLVGEPNATDSPGKAPVRTASASNSAGLMVSAGEGAFDNGQTSLTPIPSDKSTIGTPATPKSLHSSLEGGKSEQ